MQLTSRAVAVDGRAGRSTWIDRLDRNLWSGGLPRDCGQSSGCSGAAQNLLCCKGIAQVLTTLCLQLLTAHRAVLTPASLPGRADPDPSGSSRMSTPVGCGCRL